MQTRKSFTGSRSGGRDPGFQSRGQTPSFFSNVGWKGQWKWPCSYATMGAAYATIGRCENDEDENTKDSYTMVSKDLGLTFEGRLLDPWVKAGCPGSVGSVTA